jgi:transcriptional regulator with XRE-family HTH domain
MVVREIPPLKLAMLESGLTLKELERRCGVNKSYLSLITWGRMRPKQHEKAAIAKAIGRPIETLWPVAECRQ